MVPLALIANAADATISGFRVGDDGLTPLAVTKLAGPCSTFAVDPERQLLYAAIKDPLLVVTFAIDPATAELTEIARSEMDSDLCYLALTPRGDCLVAAAYYDSFARTWPLSRGELQTPGNKVEHRQAHCVAVTRDARHVYVVSLGDDQVIRYQLGADGSLSDPLVAPAPEGSGPRHLVLNQAETVAYVVTEFSGEVLAYTRDLETGALLLANQTSVVDPQYDLTHGRYGAKPLEEHHIWGADIHLSPQERALWSTERTESTLATVSVGLDGLPGEVLSWTVTEQQPRGFNVTPDGRYLLVVGEKSDSVSQYAVGQDGAPTLMGRQVTGAGANWIRFLP